MRDKGIAHIGIGTGNGEDKAVDAIKKAMESPLLETTVTGASDIIINFSGDVGIQEVYEAVSYLTEVAGDEANIIFGNVESDDVPQDEVSITIIATGLKDVSGVRKGRVAAAAGAAKKENGPTYNGNANVAGSAAKEDAPAPQEAQEVKIEIPTFLRRK